MTDVTTEAVDTSTVEAVDGQLIGMLVDRARRWPPADRRRRPAAAADEASAGVRP